MNIDICTVPSIISYILIFLSSYLLHCASLHASFMAATGVRFSVGTTVHHQHHHQRKLVLPRPSPSIIHCSSAGSKASQSSSNGKFHSLVVKASGPTQGTKTTSIVCADCDGNGAIQCKQCKGEGVNSVDHFNGRFKAGALCWLCRGKREVLCGNCNGAGFIGGFLSTHDE